MNTPRLVVPLVATILWLPARAEFQFMKVGEVQPRGWLLEQIHTDATQGYGPVLDKLTDRCEVPVFDSRNKSALVKPKIGEVWWNGETTGNWLDGLIRTAYLSGDAAAKRQVDGIVARILAMQEEDGYLGTYPKASRNYAVEGFADYEYTPQPGAWWDYAVDEGSGKFRFEKVAAKGNPWAEPPLRLTGKLFNRKTSANEPVALVPMGTSLLRRTTFGNMKLVRAMQGDANLARKAKVEVPSCAGGYRAEALVDGAAEGFPANLAAEWASKGGGVGTKVKLSWSEPIKIACVWLFDRPNPADHVQAAQIIFSDGSTAQVGDLPNDGATPFKLSFPEKTITWMEIVITKVGPRNKNAGFSEIAVFRKEPAE